MREGTFTVTITVNESHFSISQYSLSDATVGSGSPVPATDLSLALHNPQTPSHTTPPSSIFSPSHHDTLAQEFALLNIDIPNLEMERVSELKHFSYSSSIIMYSLSPSPLHFAPFACVFCG